MKTLFSRVCVEDICTVALCATPLPFIWFYLLDMLSSFSGSVLAGATGVVLVVAGCVGYSFYCT